MPENFKLKIADFEGPIEVLLRLVEEKKLHISQVALASVTDDFIAHLEKLENSDKTQMANFIFVASTLMLIKSISLLPELKITEEEKGSIEDLENRLKVYARMKELSENIKKMYGRRIIFTRQTSRELVPVFSPSQDLNLNNLREAINRVLANLPKLAEKLPQAIVQKVISLEEVIENLATRVQSALKTSFRDFVRDKKEKVNVIVSFLGMLELVKRGIVLVEQDEHFSDISIQQSEAGVPKYG